MLILIGQSERCLLIADIVWLLSQFETLALSLGGLSLTRWQISNHKFVVLFRARIHNQLFVDLFDFAQSIEKTCDYVANGAIQAHHCEVEVQLANTLKLG
jgi:hypothetical protein